VVVSTISCAVEPLNSSLLVSHQMVLSTSGVIATNAMLLSHPKNPYKACNANALKRSQVISNHFRLGLDRRQRKLAKQDLFLKLNVSRLTSSVSKSCSTPNKIPEIKSRDILVLNNQSHFVTEFSRTK